MGNKNLDHIIGDLSQTQKNKLFTASQISIIKDKSTQKTLKHKKLSLNDEDIYQQIMKICKQRVQKPSNNIVKLKHYQSAVINNFCQVSFHIDLFYEKCAQERTLTQILNINQKKCVVIFNEMEVQLMLDQIAAGLLQYEQYGFYFENFNTDYIVCLADHNYVVNDPWIAQKMSYSQFQSPQKNLFADDQIMGYCYFKSSLFSLGMILLELIDGQKCLIKYDYHNLCKRIDKIKKNSLRQKLITLLHLTPEKRMNIYYLIKKASNYSQTQKQNSKNIKNMQKEQKQQLKNMSLKLKLTNKAQRFNKHNQKQKQPQYSYKNPTMTKAHRNININTKKLQNNVNKLTNLENKQKNNQYRNRTNHKYVQKVQQNSKIRFKSSPSQMSRKSNVGISALNLRKNLANLKNNGYIIQCKSTRKQDEKSDEVIYSTQSSRESSLKYFQDQVIDDEAMVEDRKSKVNSPKEQSLQRQYSNSLKMYASNSSSNAFNTQKSLIDQLTSIRGLNYQTGHDLAINRIENILSNNSLTLNDEENLKDFPSDAKNILNYDISQVQIGYQPKLTDISNEDKAKEKQLSDSQKYPKGWSLNLSQTQKVLYFDNGFKYVGEVSGSLPNGYGVLFYPNSKKAYDGNWHNGLSHGPGIEYPLQTQNIQPLNSNKLRDEVPHKNTSEWIKFEGIFQRGKRNGKGVLIMKNGDIFKGNWVDDEAEGEGIYYHINSDQTKGMWSNSKFLRKI